MLNFRWFVLALLIKCLDVTAQQIEFETTTSDKESEVPVNNGTRHAFFRGLGAEAAPGSESRRVFGGAAADLKDFATVCALLDRYWAVRCSGAVVAPHWVLTAAHCISPRVAYVKYNTRRPASAEGKTAVVHYLYQHPKFQVVQKDEGRGMDVTALHHDVGLVRTRDAMDVGAGAAPLVRSLRLHNSYDLRNKEVTVLGFGRTERSVLGEELFSVKLQLVGCERSEWSYCVCGVARGGQPRGVCSGDSGGPVVYQDVMIGVTSMGPIECAHNGQPPPVGATSVFTSLYQYSDVVNATIYDTEAALRMRKISSPAPTLRYCRQLLLTILLVTIAR